MLQRRGLISGIAGLLVTPAIVRAASLMPVKAPRRLLTMEEYCRRLADEMLRQINPPLLFAHPDGPAEFAGFRTYGTENGILRAMVRHTEMYRLT